MTPNRIVGGIGKNCKKKVRPEESYDSSPEDSEGLLATKSFKIKVKRLSVPDTVTLQSTPPAADEEELLEPPNGNTDQNLDSENSENFRTPPQGGRNSLVPIDFIDLCDSSSSCCSSPAVSIITIDDTSSSSRCSSPSSSSEVAEASDSQPEANPISSFELSSSNVPWATDTPKKEFGIEKIEYIDAVNGEPMLFVKWPNCPATENTWETLDNLKDSSILQRFIKNSYKFLEKEVKSIKALIGNEISEKNLSFDPLESGMKALDQDIPLQLRAFLIVLAQFDMDLFRSQEDRDVVRQKALNLKLMKPFYYQRKEQLRDLKLFQDKMNAVEYLAPIGIENMVDFEVPDLSFVYIYQSFPGEDVKICDDTPIGCSCSNGICKSTKNCCSRLAGCNFPYNKHGRLKISPGEAIFECNIKCSCDDSCPNRIIQKGRKNSLCLFKTSNGCGWGVRTNKPMKKGDFVCQYAGEIITSEVANERGKVYDATGRFYLFDLDYNSSEACAFSIDSANYGNISHFFNHSCNPNLVVFPFWINKLDANMPNLAFFTLRSIKSGEELTFDYIRSDMEEKIQNNDYKNLSKAKKITCHCGFEKCRKVLF